MRIVSGEWRGRNVAAPKGDTTRPTADRTRETLFNMLNSRLGSFEELAIADLFAGSGALGLEALSRGAKHCLFVENDDHALKTLRANVLKFDARGRSDVRAMSVLNLGPAKAPLDLILLDPPYETGAAGVALDRMIRLGWLSSSTLVAVETGAKEEFKVKGLNIETERKVGKAKLWLARLAADDTQDPAQDAAKSEG